MNAGSLDVNRCANSVREQLIAYATDWMYPEPKDKTRLLIFAQGRTGSTVLEDLIFSTGHFTRLGEVIAPSKYEIRNPTSYVNGISKLPYLARVVMHVKINHLTRRSRPVSPAVFLNALHEKGFDLLYLRRTNKVLQGISNALARHRNAYTKQDDREEDPRIRIDVEWLLQTIENRLDMEARERDALRGLRYHEVVYEHDLENSDAHQQTVDAIMDFVDLPRREVHARFKKINRKQPEDLIENYDAVVQALDSRGWLSYLEE